MEQIPLAKKHSSGIPITNLQIPVPTKSNISTECSRIDARWND